MNRIKLFFSSRPRGTLTILAAAALTMAGCCTNQTAKVLEALSKDTNQVSVVMTTPWGTMTAERNIARRTPSVP